MSEDEIDELNHAGNTHYVKWMQCAAVAHSTANGWSTDRYLALGSGWGVRSHQITYLRPAFAGDQLIIRTWVASLRRVTSLRRYEIENMQGDLLARAETDWAFVRYAKQAPTRIPNDVAACFIVIEN